MNSDDHISESSSSEEEYNNIEPGLLSPLNQDDDTYGITNTRNIYISDLSGYKSMITKQLAAISLHALVSEFFTFNELITFVSHHKVSVWSKFLGKIRPIISTQKQLIKSNI